MHVEECGYLGGPHGVQGFPTLMQGLRTAVQVLGRLISSYGYLGDEAFFVNSKPKLLIFHFF